MLRVVAPLENHIANHGAHLSCLIVPSLWLIFFSLCNGPLSSGAFLPFACLSAKITAAKSSVLVLPLEKYLAFIFDGTLGYRVILLGELQL